MRESLAPFVFISGIGLLVLSMTNRLGRPIDKVRQLGQELSAATPEDQEILIKEIRQLHRRARILRDAIGLAVASILGVTIVMLMLFTGMVCNVTEFYSVPVLFGLSMVSLMASLVLFMMDIRLSLDSLKMEIDRQVRKVAV